MKRISLLSSMLMLSAVIGRETGDIAEDQAETEPPINNKAKHVRKRAVCGDIKISLTKVKRGDSRFNDTESSDENDDELPSLDKISGGNYAIYGEIPWQATILYNEIHICGGSVISEFWVISAAHCFYGFESSNFKITVGDHRLWHGDWNEKTYNLANIIVHKLYRSTELDYDIALIKIKPTGDGRGIQFNDYVRPICLAQSTERPAARTPLTCSGWGKTSKDNEGSELLKKNILPVIIYDSCKQIYSKYLTPNMFCAWKINGDSEACEGDSGSGAASRSAGSYKLYGVVAFGDGSGAPSYPVAFTSIPAYRNWIDSNIRRYGRGNETIMPVPGVTITVRPTFTLNFHVP